MRLSAKNSITLLPVITIAFTFFAVSARGQDSLPASTSVRRGWLIRLAKACEYTFLSKDSSVQQFYPLLKFRMAGNLISRKVSDKNVPRLAIIRFNVCNTADTEKGVFFFPGFYFSSIRLYRVEGTQLKLLPRKCRYTPDSTGYHYFSLPAHDSTTIVAALKWRKRTTTLSGHDLSTNYISPAYIVQVHSASDQIDMMTYLVCGLFLMMILFSFASYISGGSKEFLYYSLYGLCWAPCFSVNHSIIIHYDSSQLFYRVLSRFCIAKHRHHFLPAVHAKIPRSKKNHPFLFQVFNAGIIVLIFFHPALFSLILPRSNFALKNNIETFTKFFLTLILVPVVIVTVSATGPIKFFVI